MTIIELKPYFVGSGTVKGMIFNQISFSVAAYLYEINNFGVIHYEVFKRRSNGIMLNFEKREYSTEIKKEQYPKDENFGVWAWYFKDLESAERRFKRISSNELVM